MSKTTQYRYEVSSPGYGAIEHVSKFEEAVKVSERWIEREKTPTEIFDRMARKDRPNLWSVSKCTGEAHSNPHIDHCSICAPYWETVVKSLGRLEDRRAVEETEEKPPFPSFFAHYGRKPIAGKDYDPEGALCQDDYEYFTGTGRYTDHPEKVFQTKEIPNRFLLGIEE